MRILLSSENQTFCLGIKIAKILKGGEMILLRGDMGTGKTILTKGIAAGLGISSEISSPTFTLLNIYSGRLTLYHYDLFRLESFEEAEESGLTEYFGDKSGVCVIEWPDKALIKKEYYSVIEIELIYIDNDSREAEICGSAVDGGAWGIL